MIGNIVKIMVQTSCIFGYIIICYLPLLLFVVHEGVECNERGDHLTDTAVVNG
uniref:Uncharacterized protein n=1 Tax=Arion vulgaris TaxID=1028688 RepID=A0A0B6ZRP2_9EUPU